MGHRRVGVLNHISCGDVMRDCSHGLKVAALARAEQRPPATEGTQAVLASIGGTFLRVGPLLGSGRPVPVRDQSP